MGADVSMKKLPIELIFLNNLLRLKYETLFLSSNDYTIQKNWLLGKAKIEGDCIY